MEDTPGLHWVDWIVFGAMVVASLVIGLYHSGRQRSTSEYLMGNHDIQVIPAAMSLTVSFISSILILGEPAEMYTFGGQLWISKFGWMLGAVLSTIIFVPVLHPLKLTSVNEYIELRYQSRVPRLILSIYSVMSTIFYAAIVSFGQAIAIEAVTGFPTWATILIGNIAALIYTTLGGLRGVVWTDVFQSVIMVLGLLAVVIQGFISVGSFTRMFEINAEWGRLDLFDFDPDPTKRVNFYGCIFGGALSWMSVYGHVQTGFQRYAAMPTTKKAKQVVLLTIPGSFLLGTLASLAGLCIFAHFTNIGCDPLAAGIITNPNQIGPYFVVTALNFPGVCGLYFACIAAGCLSTISSVLNAAAGQVWDDMIKPYWDITDTKATIVTKCIVLVGGILTVLLSICVSQLGGNIVQMIATFGSALGGPMAGLFLMGFFLPWANWKGASVGCIFGTIFSLWVAFGSYSIDRHLSQLPTNTANCEDSETLISNTTAIFTTETFNDTYIATTELYASEDRTLTGIDRLYALSFMWMKEVATAITIGVSMIISLATGFTDPKTVDSGCLHPCIRRYFKKSSYDEKDIQKTDEVLKLRDLKVNDVEENFSNEETEKRAQIL